MLQKRNLDKRALEYVKEYLALWRMPGSVLSNLDLEMGKIWTYLPFEITDEIAYNFNTAGIAPRSNQKFPLASGFFISPVNKLGREIIGKFVEEFINNQPNGICLIDDRLHNKEDFEGNKINDERLDYPVLFYSNEAYF